MNKYIKRELEKCKVAQIPEFDESTTQLLISRTGKGIITQVTGELYQGQKYLIQVENYIVNPFPGFDLHDNWNNGIIPTDKQMEIKVDQIMGKMIKVSAIGYSDRKPWNGWLPRKSIHIIKEL